MINRICSLPWRRILLYCGLIFLPFCIYLDLFPIVAGPIKNVRYSKDILSYIIASAFVVVSIHKGKIIKNPCKPLSILLFYLTAHWLIAPPYNLEILGENVAGFWIFRTLIDVYLCYFMVMGIASMDWWGDWLKETYNLFSFIALISSIYIFIQALGWDQWQSVYNIVNVKAQTNPHITSFYGQTNFASSFLSLLIPFIVCQKKWITLALTSIAVCLTGSLMGIGMMLSAYIICGLAYGNKFMRAVILFWMLTIPVYVLNNFNAFFSLFLKHTSGRVGAWQEAMTEMLNPSISEGIFMITGYGLGSYEFILKNLGSTGFSELHNEWFEFFIHTGLLGWSLLIICIFWLFKNLFPIIIRDRYMLAAACSFLVVCIGNMGLFMWQIEPHRFYTVFLLGLFFNRLKKGVNNV